MYLNGLEFQYRKKLWWWKVVHFNYFHKRLFKEYYVQKKNFSKAEIRKYQIFIVLDNLITFRYFKWYHNILFYFEKSYEKHLLFVKNFLIIFVFQLICRIMYIIGKKSRRIIMMVLLELWVLTKLLYITVK